jgi:hypothetical protein
MSWLASPKDPVLRKTAAKTLRASLQSLEDSQVKDVLKWVVDLPSPGLYRAVVMRSLPKSPTQPIPPKTIMAITALMLRESQEDRKEVDWEKW